MSTKPGVTLGALPLTRLVARLDAGEAEDVEALGQNGVFALDFARRTSHQLFHFLQFLVQDLVGGTLWAGGGGQKFSQSETRSQAS